MNCSYVLHGMSRVDLGFFTFGTLELKNSRVGTCLSQFVWKITGRLSFPLGASRITSHLSALQTVATKNISPCPTRPKAHWGLIRPKCWVSWGEELWCVHDLFHIITNHPSDTLNVAHAVDRLVEIIVLYIFDMYFMDLVFIYHNILQSRYFPKKEVDYLV